MNMEKLVKETEMPSTAEATRALAETERNIAETAKYADLSRTGKTVVEKVEHALETSKVLLQEKNRENTFQELVHELKLAGATYKVPANEMFDMAQETYDALTDDVKAAFRDVLSLSALFLKSRQFRHLLSEITSLARDFLDLVSGVAAETAASAKQTVQARVPEQAPSAKDVTPEKAKEAAEEAMEVGDELAQSIKEQSGKLTEQLQSSFSQDRFMQLYERFKSLVKQIQSSKEWQQGIEHLWSVSHRFYADLAKLTEAVQEKGPASVQSEGLQHLKKAQMCAKKLLGNFAGGRSVDDILGLYQTGFDSVQKDQRLVELFSNLNGLLQKVVKEKGAVGDELKGDLQNLMTKLESLKDLEWLGTFQRALAETNVFITSVARDKLLNQFAADWSDLLASLFLDDSGQLVLKPELFYDLGKIARVVVERLKLVVVGGISHSDDEYDYTLQNIYLESREDQLLPQYSRVRFTTKLDERRAGPYYLLEMKFSRMQAEAKNIHFWYNKKTMPRMSDEGLADIATRDEGFELYIDLVPDFSDPKTLFHVSRVEALFNEFELNVHESHHQILYTIMSPLLRKRVQNALEESVERYITEYLEKLGQQLKQLTSQAPTLMEIIE